MKFDMPILGRKVLKWSHLSSSQDLQVVKRLGFQGGYERADIFYCLDSTFHFGHYLCNKSEMLRKKSISLDMLLLFLCETHPYTMFSSTIINCHSVMVNRRKLDGGNIF